MLAVKTRKTKQIFPLKAKHHSDTDGRFQMAKVLRRQIQVYHFVANGRRTFPPGRSESSFQVRPSEVSNATKFLGGRFFSLLCGVNYFLRLTRTCFGYTSFLWINSGYSALVSQMTFLFHI